MLFLDPRLALPALQHTGKSRIYSLWQVHDDLWAGCHQIITNTLYYTLQSLREAAQKNVEARDKCSSFHERRHTHLGRVEESLEKAPAFEKKKKNTRRTHILNTFTDKVSRYRQMK